MDPKTVRARNKRNYFFIWYSVALVLAEEVNVFLGDTEHASINKRHFGRDYRGASKGTRSIIYAFSNADATAGSLADIFPSRNLLVAFRAWESPYQRFTFLEIERQWS